MILASKFIKEFGKIEALPDGTLRCILALHSRNGRISGLWVHQKFLDSEAQQRLKTEAIKRGIINTQLAESNFLNQKNTTDLPMVDVQKTRQKTQWFRHLKKRLKFFLKWADIIIRGGECHEKHTCRNRFFSHNGLWRTRK